MRITHFELTPLKQRGLLLQIFTDVGLVGYGSPMNYEHGRTVERAIHDMGDYLIGRDPRQIEDHWQVLFRSSYSRQMPILISALSGIEHACLDILGKSLDTPIWQLLGGTCRDRLRVYSGVSGPNPEAYRKNSQIVLQQGFTAIKLTPFPDPVRFLEPPAIIEEVVERVASVRETVGSKIDIAVDFHRAASPAMAKILLKELEPFKPLFVEEPTHPENTDALLEITRSTTIPIATGERHTTRWGFRELVEKKAAAILQPDIRHCGGILEMRKIAALAEIHYLSMAPHSAADPVGIVAAAHAMAATPNFLIMEFGGGTGEKLFKKPLVYKDGYLELPQGPGLGIEIDNDGLADSSTDKWHLRKMRRHPDDGSLTDI